MDIFPSDGTLIAVMIVLCIINLATVKLCNTSVPLEFITSLAIIVGIRHIDTISGIITVVAGSISLAISLGYGISVLITWIKERK